MASAVSNIHAGSNGNERFNDEALSWDARPFVHEASQAASDAISSRLQNVELPKGGAQVLEIGCGTGILSFLMAKDPKVARIVAVDAAQGMIDVLKTKLDKDESAKSKILPLALMLEDPEDAALPADDHGHGRQKFDIITSHLVLHHIPDLRSVLQTMHGCLAPGGCLMLTDFEDFGPEAKRFHPAGKMAGVARHGINAKDMAVMLQEIGLEDVDVTAAWTMKKTVEKFDGEFAAGNEEFGNAGATKVEKGEIMEFPFLLCYGLKK
ncbi:Putative S-adenosyl-L-methionine-dependent methyltransferase [Septoria linicola]|uniref:S-adenosyl-L-methionine-dependent methyltransferase n=1 Tax=Septoria linicola TaxID=215465 RepID=A0A9Q9EM70_9PEZI|nr:putative S-adenosyl-L-methionine-dependent methyltransferase [Septoria linicola]USW55217.1 Putative S-adenosyl-L-methionine-dependent methyltransferase [Septoria linicola]